MRDIDIVRQQRDIEREVADKLRTENRRLKQQLDMALAFLDGHGTIGADEKRRVLLLNPDMRAAIGGSPREAMRKKRDES